MAGGGGGRPARLLARLLGKLRPTAGAAHHQRHHLELAVNYSIASTVMSGSTERSSVSRSIPDDEDFESHDHRDTETPERQPNTTDHRDTETTEREPNTAEPSQGYSADDAVNIDLRYGGQYFTPEQLPRFCEQLRQLVRVVRNVQAYAALTGEYPASLERRVSREADEVCALLAEACNARDVIERARSQGRALRARRRLLRTELGALRDTETRELENKVRQSDRKLYKSWEALKDSTDPNAYETLLDDVRSKQSALESLVRLVESRRAQLSRRPPAPPAPRPLPPPPAAHNHDDEGVRGRGAEAARRGGKRRREARSVPLSGHTSEHRDDAYTGIGCRSRYRVGSGGAIELPARQSTRQPATDNRDIMFFTGS